MARGRGCLLRLARVQELLTSLFVDTPDRLPGHFQILFRVDLIDVDEEVVQVQPMFCRVLD